MTLVQRGRGDPGRAEGAERRDPGGGVQPGLSTTTRRPGRRCTSAPTSCWPGRPSVRRLTEDPSGKTLCIIQAQGSVALETRCAGVKSAYANTENLQVNGADLPSVQQTIQSKLAQDSSITNIVTLGAPIALAALQAQEASSNTAKLVTFDLNQEAAQAIKDGKIQFSVDQQPYVQGYMAVDDAVDEHHQRQRHRWRQAHVDRPVDRRHDQHRPDPALHRQQPGGADVLAAVERRQRAGEPASRPPHPPAGTCPAVSVRSPSNSHPCLSTDLPGVDHEFSCYDPRRSRRRLPRRRRRSSSRWPRGC